MMKTAINSFFFLFLLTGSSHAQSVSEEDTTVYRVAEKMPEYTGSRNGLYSDLTKINYHQCAGDVVCSKVYFEFVVTKSGKVENCRALLCRQYNECITEQFSRIMQHEKCVWMPGEIKGEKVNVKMVMPATICFRQ